MTRVLSINITDTHIGIWQDDANDPTFRTDVYLALLGQLRRRGWSISADPHILRHYRSLSKNTRLAQRGDMRAEIQLTGRVVKLEFWATTWPLDNRNGPRYNFRKLERMNYLDRLRFALEVRRVIGWLEQIAAVTVKDGNAQRPGRGRVTALEAIETDYASSWHRDKDLGRPVPGPYARNYTSAEGEAIKQGSTVWFAQRDGRINRGAAYYNLNNMWWVVFGRYARTNLGAHELYCQPPTNLRVKRNDRVRRGRLEQELATATRRMDFKRAETLKSILFGDQAPWMIWARDHDAYYRANYAGYTTDTISAGRYTHDEALREVKRCPEDLEAHGPNGERLRFDRAAA